MYPAPLRPRRTITGSPAHRSATAGVKLSMVGRLARCLFKPKCGGLCRASWCDLMEPPAPPRGGGSPRGIGAEAAARLDSCDELYAGNRVEGGNGRGVGGVRTT